MKVSDISIRERVFELLSSEFCLMLCLHAMYVNGCKYFHQFNDYKSFYCWTQRQKGKSDFLQQVKETQ